MADAHPGYATPPDSREAALRSEIGRLRTALRVNILRLAPGTAHAEIDALIEGIANEGRQEHPCPEA